MKETLESLIANEVNPVLKNHNGGCELISLIGGVAEIKLTGSCSGCPGKRHTFNEHIVPFLLENVEGLKSINLI